MKTLLHFLLLSLLILQKVFSQNTVYGTGAGTGGSHNTHIGYYAGRISTGTQNTFLGGFSGYSNTTGSYNTFIGYVSGSANSTGRYNTFLGFSSGQFNSSGTQNTFLGSHSGLNNTTGSRNIFLGYFSGNRNTTGGYNTFLGVYSGASNTTGRHNTFLGPNSGFKNTTGSDNIFIGGYSGYENTTGHFNTFIGINSGTFNTDGAFNTFLGTYSGINNRTGDNNTFLGYQTGLNNQTGNNNVFIGYQAGYGETGSNKFYIDNSNDSNPLLYGNFSSNVLSIGMKYTGTTYKLVVPGRVRATAYDIVSDERLKKDVHALQHVLAKVQKIKSVSYGFKEDATTRQDQREETQAEQQLHYGFLAQNIQEVFPELVTEDEGFLAVNYQGLIPVLVEAVKELSLQKDSLSQLQGQLHQVLQKNTQLEQDLAAIKQALQLNGLISTKPEVSSTTGSILEQNHPNPFEQVTTIRYQTPPQAQKVSLLITNLQGVVVKSLDDLAPGQGQIEVEAGSLSAGTYIYTLVVDGKPQATQKMILTR